MGTNIDRNIFKYIKKLGMYLDECLCLKGHKFRGRSSWVSLYLASSLSLSFFGQIMSHHQWQ